jgi:hypothetical protein
MAVSQGTHCNDLLRCLSLRRRGAPLSALLSFVLQGSPDPTTDDSNQRGCRTPVRGGSRGCALFDRRAHGLLPARLKRKSQVTKVATKVAPRGQGTGAGTMTRMDCVDMA